MPPLHDMTIRPLEAADLPALVALIDATGLFPGELLPDMARTFLEQSPTTDAWFVMTRDGSPAAVAYVVPERLTQGTYNLLLIAVHADHQGKGLGKDLMAHVESHLSARDGRLLLVETSGLPDFERTRQFYLNNGYGIEARIREFYAPGEDKVIFRKEL